MIFIWAIRTYAILILGSMATMSIGAAILGIAMFLAWPGGFTAFRRDVSDLCRIREVRAYLWASLVLIACLLITLSVQGIWTIEIGRTQDLEFFRNLLKGWYLLWPIPLAAAFLKLSEEERNKTLYFWIGTLAVISVIGIQQHFTGWPRPQQIPEMPTYFHATMFFGHHLSAASILIFPFFAALDLLIEPRISRRKRLTLASICLFACAGLILGFSRTLWVALPVSLFFWFLLALPKRARVAAAVGAVIAMIGVAQLPVVQKRLVSGMNITQRERLWGANVELFQMRPMTGTGFMQNNGLAGALLIQKYPNEEVFGGHAHNNFLQMVGGTGVLGTIPWLFWCGLVVGLTWKSILCNSLGIGRGLVAAWVAFHINGLTQVNFWEGKVEHQMAWACAWALVGVALVSQEKKAHV